MNATYLQNQMLARLLKHPDLLIHTSSMVKPDYFEDGLNRHIYETLKTSYLNGNGADPLHLSKEAKNENVLPRILELTTRIDWSIKTDTLLNSVFEIIKKDKIRRMTMRLNEMETEEPEKVISFISEFIDTFDTSGYIETKTMIENVDDVLKIVEFNKRNTGLTGADTGFRSLNRITNGLQGGDLIIIAGETSQGKTSFALNIAQKVGETDKVYLVTCEMMPSQITARMLANVSEIGSNHILTGKLTEEETQQLKYHASKVAYNNLLINEKDNDIDKIIANIRMMKVTKGIKMVVIDYLQLIHSNERASKEQQIGTITRRLKNLAKELDIPIILLSQLNRDKQNPYPVLSRLRDSGQIEEAADLVIFIYRAEFYGLETFLDGEKAQDKALVIVAKGRNTGIGKFYVNFNKHLTRFSDELPTPY